MKITFLGSSHGVPSSERFCSCAMIEVGEALYFIDAGVPMIDLLLRYGKSIEASKAVFTTHAHGDHINGIIGFANLINWYYKDASVDLFMTEENSTKAIIDYLEALEAHPIDSERVRFKVIDESFVYDDGNIKVTPIKTEHLRTKAARRPAYGYIIEAEGKRVVFSGDLSIHLRDGDFPQIALLEEVDLVVCEMAHFSAEEVTPFLDRCKAKEVWFNHVYPLDKFDKIIEMDKKYPFGVKIAEDGSEIIL